MSLPNEIATPLLTKSAEQNPDRPAPRIADAHEEAVTNPDLTDVDAALRSFFTSSPAWLKTLLEVRNKIVSRLGFETGSAERPELPQRFTIGDELGTFTVLDRSNDEIVMGGEDKRFGLEISVWLPTAEDRLQVTTIAHSKDAIGKAYLTLVARFHGPIAAMLTKRMAAGIR